MFFTKKLIQNSEDVKWHKQLAHCYLQRALLFADKGMAKEAVVLWDNYIQHAEAPFEAYDQYIICLIQAKNTSRIKSTLEQLSAEQIDKQYPELATFLGFLMISGSSELQQYLPQDSVFIEHFKYVQSAMTASQAGDIEEVTATLKKIPYRSAFKDFRTLLNAVLVTHDHNNLTLQVKKIPTQSPYSQAAQLLSSSCLEGAELVNQLAQFSKDQRKVIVEIKGFNKKQGDLVDQLTRQYDRLSDKIKFNLTLKYQELCDSDVARNYCQVALANYSAGRRDFKKHFTEPNIFEQNRIKAIQLERDKDHQEAEFYWQQCVKTLSEEKEDNGLKIALILRRLAGFYPESDVKTDLLVDSLQYDPDDRETTLKVVSYYGQSSDSIKEYKNWLAKTLEKFPKDIEVLTLAINTALANKAFKKSCLYAEKILKFDPLNTFAKQTLFSSHLAHVRRLIKEKKYHLLDKEIAQAEKLNLGKSFTQKTELMRGVSCFVSQDKTEGLKLITASLQGLNSDPVNMHFQGAMEALLAGLPVTTVLKGLPVIKGYKLSVSGLTELLEQLKYYSDDSTQHDFIHKALEKIKGPFKQSLIKQKYEGELLRNFCEIFDQINHYELIRHCAKVAINEKKWFAPIWSFYKIYAQVNGNAEKLSTWEVHSLKMNHSSAEEFKDHRTRILIESFIDQYYESNFDSGPSFFDGLFGFDDDVEEDEDPFDLLFEHIPESVFDKLDKEASRIMKNTKPDKLVKQFAKGCELDLMFLASTMQENPDIFSALIIVKAADNLNIDINTSYGNVLEVFSISDNSNSPLF